MAYSSQLYKMSMIEEDQISPSDLIVEVGESAFASTGTTVEVATRLTQCIAASITPVDPAYATNTSADQVGCDRIISSDAITVTRGASGTSGMKFSYVFAGFKAAVVV